MPINDEELVEIFKKLNNNVIKVNYARFSIVDIPYNVRLKLWENLKEAYKKYLKKDYIYFPDLDKEIKKYFEWTLSVIAFSFYYNNEPFPEIYKYNDSELKAVEYLLKLKPIEGYSVNDIIKAIKEKNNNEILYVLKEYVNKISYRMGELLKGIKNPILKEYIYEKWLLYKSKIDEALVYALKDPWFVEFLKCNGIEDCKKLLKNKEINFDLECYRKWFYRKIKEKLNDMIENGLSKIENKKYKIKYIDDKNKILAILEEKKPLPIKRSKILLYCVCKNNLISLKDLLNILKRLNFNNNFKKVIVVVASSVGFDERAIYVLNSEYFINNVLKDKISLILLDIKRGKVYYGLEDEYAKALDFPKLLYFE
ncbi:hypothetical protein J422_05244 [Methanocaldococcus villosus KIN24-T80]|uniref:Uncharacterized protein n=1 Tax=Methanocaldococcus villosus KIN24-T80 TaxID=1069083 RepID=N6VPU8_9EURY|nr:hypothetical protein [Methanocaldococcus villosus]ENN95925.1 hypothetical protein J422_05244 [Methanocaldococcus villosus KIN24-T80]